MEKGRIEIVIEEGRTPYVEAELVDGNIQMAKFEIARFFNCFNQKIEMNLRSIFKSRLLWEDDVSFTYRYMDKGIEKQIVYYNLEVLIFLSYRIATFEAKIFRQFINSALREQLQKKKAEKCIRLLWHYRKTKEFWLN
jgi:hypothetical protein